MENTTLTFLSKNLKFIRLALGYTQNDLSEIVGMSRHTIIKIEKGKQDLSVIMARSLTLLIVEEIHKDEISKMLLNLEGLEFLNVYIKS